MGVGSGQNKNLNTQKKYVEFNACDGNNKSNMNDDEKIRKDIKIILFLLMQQNELKLEQENKIEQSFDNKNFYIVRETLENYNKIYDINQISDYAKKILKLSLKKYINWEETVKDIISYTKIFKGEKDKININSIKNRIEYLNTNYIKFPSNFSLIEEQFIDIFKDISNSYFEKDNIKSGYVFNINNKDTNNKIVYILLNYELKNDSKIYFSISLEKEDYKVDYIFLVDKNFDEKNFIEIAKKAIEETNNNKIHEKNKKIDINQYIKIIYNPENEPENDIVFNNNLYNKIMNDFSIIKLYISSIGSFNNIKNNELKKIESKNIDKIIYNQKKLLEETYVYLIDANHFKKNILEDELNFFLFQIYLRENDINGKKKIIEDIFIDEDKKKDNKNIKDLMKLLTYNDIFNNKEISLISTDLYQRIFNKANIDYANIGINLLKINGEYYLYFNKEKILVKIAKSLKDNQRTSIHDENTWIIEDKQIKTDNNYKKEIKINTVKDLIISETIIKKIFLICQQYKVTKKLIEDNKIGEINNYSLINEEWLNQYEEHYRYNDIIKNATSINIEYENYERYKEYLNNIDYKKFDINIKDYRFINFPEELKDSRFIYPNEVKYLSFKFPNHFNIIKTDLLHQLIKEKNSKEEYNININIEDKKDYKIILGNKLIILVENNNNKIIIYSYKDKKYNPEYIFDFINSNILKEQIVLLKTSKNIKDYISQLGINIKSDKIQEIKYKNNKIGKFSIIKEVLSIESFQYPPLIGLENVGATCYMNATLQCFSNVDLLTDYFLSKKDFIEKSKKDYTLADEFLKVVINLWNKDIDFNKRFYAPNDFKKRIGEKNSLFSGIAANDSKDLILFILEELHNDLNEPNEINETKDDSIYNISNIDINNSNISNNKINNNNINPIYNEFDMMNNLINNNQNNIPNINLIDIEQKNYKEFITEYEQNNNSIIKDIFYCVQESICVCNNCQARLYSFSIINFLIFPLEKVRQFLLSQNLVPFTHVTLENCFQQYISGELLTGENKLYCNNCKLNSDAVTYNILYGHPKVLIIILNRGQGLQFNVPFKYPNEFVINNFINMIKNPNYENNNNKNITYELISVITHMGESGMSGHFIACAKSPVNGNWYMYNDAIVSECQNPLDIFGSNTTSSIPYVLFYKLKESN